MVEPLFLPIAVISCNRPAYLAQTLSGLRASIVEADINYVIGLFQDIQFGGNNLLSLNLSKDCVDAFNFIFPEGEVYEASSNLGTALNYARAEEWAFQERVGKFRNTAAFFLEDDFVPNKSTLICIDRLLKLEKNGFPIGAVSAAGHIQDLQAGVISPMGQLWAYALTKKAYIKTQAKMLSYRDILIKYQAGRIQQYPPLDQCLELAIEWGFEPQAAGCDSFLAMALHSEGFIQVATKGVFGKYIGVVGKSFNHDIFKDLGWNQREEEKLAASSNEILDSCKKYHLMLRKHQEDQFFKSHLEFYSDSCKEAYVAGRFNICKKIAERALLKWGSCSCRGNPFCFERHYIKSITRMGQQHEACKLAKQAEEANLGTWGYWAIAVALEDDCSWTEAAEYWQLVNNCKTNNS